LTMATNVRTSSALAFAIESMMVLLGGCDHGSNEHRPDRHG
jgi:hypothetical protein